jgi:hypothetical protein
MLYGMAPDDDLATWKNDFADEYEDDDPEYDEEFWD